MDHPNSLSNDELLAATRDLVRRSSSMEADLLVHLGEIDERKLYLDRAYSSMFIFCPVVLSVTINSVFHMLRRENS